MKVQRLLFITCLILAVQLGYGQHSDPFVLNYNLHKMIHSETANDYKDVKGSPYQYNDFINGVFYLQDSSKIILPIRYNIYEDKMEYKIKDVIYSVGNPEIVQKIEIGQSVFIYNPNLFKGGFFEIVESGKCILMHKMVVVFKPAEGPKPIVGEDIPAQFVRKPDIVYLVVDSKAFGIKNLNSVIDALKDQKPKIENFIKVEKIRNIKNDNLNKIVLYYNSL